MTAADIDSNAIGLYIPVSTPEIHDVTYYAVQILVEIILNEVRVAYRTPARLLSI